MIFGRFLAQMEAASLKNKSPIEGFCFLRYSVQLETAPINRLSVVIYCDRFLEYLYRSDQVFFFKHIGDADLVAPDPLR